MVVTLNFDATQCPQPNWPLGRKLYKPVVKWCLCKQLQDYAFCGRKIIGGVSTPTPVDDLGMNQMAQAIDLIDVSYEQVKKYTMMYAAIRKDGGQMFHVKDSKVNFDFYSRVMAMP